MCETFASVCRNMGDSYLRKAGRLFQKRTSRVVQRNLCFECLNRKDSVIRQSLSGVIMRAVLLTLLMEEHQVSQLRYEGLYGSGWRIAERVAQ